MARTGMFGGFAFDPEVFADYVAENPTWSNAIINSGIIAEDSTIMSLIGDKGNVATLPFYKPISVDSFAPYNNDGLTDNVPKEIEGSKQTAMLIQRMMAFKAKDFTKELTGSDPMAHIASSVANYYQQVWQNELMGILGAVMSLSGMAGHILDVTSSTSTISDANKVSATSMIDAEQKAFGDFAGGKGLALMHSAIYAQYQKLGLIEYAKYNDANALAIEVALPTINGLIVVKDDRGTVDTSGSVPVYTTTIIGEGAFLTATKNNYENPYYTDYDAETSAGVEKLYTKQGRVLHPNGFSIKADSISKESPTTAELKDNTNWELKFNDKNIRIGQIKSNG